MVLRRSLNCISRDVEVPSGDDFAFGVIEALHGVTNTKWLWVWGIERVPNHIKPVGIAKLSRFVPLVRGEPNRLAAGSPLRLDAAEWT